MAHHTKQLQYFCPFIVSDSSYSPLNVQLSEKKHFLFSLLFSSHHCLRVRVARAPGGFCVKPDPVLNDGQVVAGSSGCISTG